MTRNASWRLTAAIVVAGMLATAPPARAQRSGEGFLFHAPTGSFVLRLGFDQPSAGSDLFSETTSLYTLRKSDFRGPSIGGELNAKIGPRTELVFAAAWSGSRRGSEYRNFDEVVGTDTLAIRQTTSFERVPLTVGVRYYVTAPGEAIGHLAWVPSRYAPWVGGGIGAMWYQFRQSGDFINLSTMAIFPDNLRSSDWTLTAHVNAGVDVSVSPRLFLTAEGRYTWAQAHLGPDFSGFNPIDLSGLALTLGVGYRM